MWYLIVLLIVAVIMVTIIIVAAIKKQQRTVTPTIPQTQNTTATTPANAGHGGTKTASGGTGFFGVIFQSLGVIAVVIVLFWMGSCSYGFYKWVNKPTPPPSLPQSTKTRKLYKFDEGGCANKIEIKKGEASWYPKGGEVTIYPPSPAKPWEDAPGILTKEEGVPHPEGAYKVCKKSPEAWGIEVWN
jgi:hypothetical protein